MTDDPRDHLIDFPYADMLTSELLAYLDCERRLAGFEQDPVTQRTHALRVALLQREVAVRNRRATIAIDGSDSPDVLQETVESLSQANVALEALLKARDERIADLESQLLVAGEHRDTYQGRARTLGNEASRLSELVEVLRCGDLSAYSDGELEEDRAAAFRDHLRRCADCQDGLRQNAALDARIADLARARQATEPTITPLTDERLQEIEQRLAVAIVPPPQSGWRAEDKIHVWRVAQNDVVTATPELLTEILRLRLTAGGL